MSATSNVTLPECNHCFFAMRMIMRVAACHNIVDLMPTFSSVLECAAQVTGVAPESMMEMMNPREMFINTSSVTGTPEEPEFRPSVWLVEGIRAIHRDEEPFELGDTDPTEWLHGNKGMAWFVNTILDMFPNMLEPHERDHLASIATKIEADERGADEELKGIIRNAFTKSVAEQRRRLN